MHEIKTTLTAEIGDHHCEADQEEEDDNEADGNANQQIGYSDIQIEPNKEHEEAISFSEMVRRRREEASGGGEQGNNNPKPHDVGYESTSAPSSPVQPTYSDVSATSLTQTTEQKRLSIRKQRPRKQDNTDAKYAKHSIRNPIFSSHERFSDDDMGSNYVVVD